MTFTFVVNHCLLIAHLCTIIQGICLHIHKLTHWLVQLTQNRGPLTTTHHNPNTRAQVFLWEIVEETPTTKFYFQNKGKETIYQQRKRKRKRGSQPLVCNIPLMSAFSTPSKKHSKQQKRGKTNRNSHK
jgi:hypothetical protein